MSTANEEVQLKLAQLYQAISNDSDTTIIKTLLDKGIDLNSFIPVQYLDASIKIDFECTILHVAYVKGKLDTFKVLLEYGADFTIPNQSGSTVLHHIFQNPKIKYPDNQVHFNDSFISAILSAHVRFGNSHNPSDKNGLSHFHIACMANHIDAAKFFLSYGASIDQSVNVDSSIHSGYRPLHFAAGFFSYETAEFLISNGANMHLKNLNGLTPLHVLIKERLKVYYCKGAEQSKEPTASVLKAIEVYEKIINLFLMNDTSDSDDADLYGLTIFHVACTLQDSSVATCLSDRVADINHAVMADSPIYPGYTALHFAAHCSLETVKVLMKEGADLRTEDEEGVTPLDICMQKFKLEDMHCIVASVPTWKNLLFSDCKTKLLDCILVMKNPATLNVFLQNCDDINVSLPQNSPLWPGYTPLHLAVLFSERFKADNEPEALVSMCLDRGANIHAQDKLGWTPLHLAFRHDKSAVTTFLMKIHGQPSTETRHLSDEDNLSYLHMSCTEPDHKYSFRKLLSTERINGQFVKGAYKGRPLKKVKSGWTALHVAADYNSSLMIDWLLDRGASFLCTDAHGFTVFHRFFALNIRDISTRMASVFEQLDERVAKSTGLTHLHVASWLNNPKAVQKLLEKGSDIDATLELVVEDEKLAKFAGFTPLHVAMMNQSTEAVKELLQWGADIFAKKPDSTSPLSQALTDENEKMSNLFMLLLWSNDELQRSMEKELGLTLLHLACHALDTKKVRALLKNVANVNARTREDSNVWPGCTALHVLMRRAEKFGRWSYGWDNRRKGIILELLLASGADATVTDARGCSPLRMIAQHFRNFNDSENFDLLLKHHRDYKINPTDNTGLSYFHLACLVKNLETIERFLQQGNVDVNQTIDSFAGLYAGCTPLNLTVQGIRRYDDNDDFTLRIVELLLDHGAKIYVEDSLGDTPLHHIIRLSRGRNRLSLMKKLLCWMNEKNVNTRNINGETMMEILLLKWGTVEEIKLLLDHGGIINACNLATNRGYIAILFSSHHVYQHVLKDIKQMTLKSAELTKLDELGRNAIHNSVTVEQTEVLEKDLLIFITELIKLGCDIDHQDSFGKTALHLAVQFGNVEAARSLLTAGADINIVDPRGRSAFSYVFESAVNSEQSVIQHCKQRILVIFVAHVTKLRLVGIGVSLLNSTIYNGEKSRFVVRNAFYEQVRATENVKFGRRELTLHSFLCETGAISAYPSITPTERKEIAAFFENIRNIQGFSELQYMLLLQYRKAEERLSLVVPAADALENQLKFPLPDLCFEIILKYLSNSELKSLIEASRDGEDMRMIFD